MPAPPKDPVQAGRGHSAPIRNATSLSVFVISGHLVVGSTPTTGPGLGRSERVTYGPTPDIAPVYADSIIERLAVDRQVQAAEKPRPR